jgi:Zn-dependent membrane protease YugP
MDHSFLIASYMDWWASQFHLLIIMLPAILLAIWAQFKVRSTYAAAMREPASMSGARAAREILDRAGLRHIRIEETPGHLSDHYDPREKVLRLSPDVFHHNSLASVGIAAHEAGHAIQDARGYVPLVVRNAAVPLANFGGSISMLLIMAAFIMNVQALLWAGIIAFGCVVVFQLVNLPVEFNASTRAKTELASLGIVSQRDIGPVKQVLDAAAWTYVAATLQSVLTLLYYLMRASNQRD